MEVNLSVRDRLAIIAMLPIKGTIVEVGEILDLVKLLRFSDDEKKSINYREADGKIIWDIANEEARDFNLNFEQVKILKETVNKLDEEGKVDFNNYEICYKISKL